jgi:hypothetical protein
MLLNRISSELSTNQFLNFHWQAKQSYYKFLYTQALGSPPSSQHKNYRFSEPTDKDLAISFRILPFFGWPSRSYSTSAPIIHKMLTSDVFVPAADGSWPSIDEIMKYIAYRADDYSSQDELKHSIRLSKNIIDNFRKLNDLFSYKEPSFGTTGLKEEFDNSTPINKFMQQFFYPFNKIPLLTDTVFVHTTNYSNAIALIESNGEFANQYFNASLFDPKNDSVKCYPSYIGLILEVPTESIIASYHFDIFAIQNADSTNHTLIAANYQIRAIKNYINSILINSKVKPEYNPNHHYLIGAIISELKLNELQYLIKKYQILVPNMTEAERATEFNTLFRREGNDIVFELKNIYQKTNILLQRMIRLPITNPFQLYGKYLLGKFEGKEEIMRRRVIKWEVGEISPNTSWNNLVIHSPANCRELGLQPPKIRGVLQIRNISGFDRSVISTARRYNLPIYQHPTALRD